MVIKKSIFARQLTRYLSGREVSGCLELEYFCIKIITILLCILQLEAYWNYELCHGKHLRQYHEEKEAGKVSEFFFEFQLPKFV